ncbi:MAG: polysaccharide biosynthesis protein [Cytophagaceae bacterium]|nr:polysaccharide biosynthesis protein [Cytophagaceae bacterium]MDW8455707.1 nucleoside-diphosphate sugar epimerase/dehydratase [Cytophagaceae bacterium]
MTNRLNKISGWSLYGADLFLCLSSLFFSFLLRFNFQIPLENIQMFSIVFPVVLIVKGIVFYLTGTFRMLVKYSSVEDAKKIFIAQSIATLFIGLISYAYVFYGRLYLIPISVILIDFMLSLLFLGALRVIIKILYYESRLLETTTVNVLIYGADEMGIHIKEILLEDQQTNYNVVAFIDDRPFKWGSQIHGIKVYDASQYLGKLISKHSVQVLVMASQPPSAEKKNELLEICFSLGVRVRTVPPIHKWMKGEISIDEIKEIDVEDVIGRPLIEYNNEFVYSEMYNKRILITGAAGSIGSELVKQIMRYKPALLVLIDNAETPLYMLDSEISAVPITVAYKCITCDVRDRNMVEAMIAQYRPDIIFHAAAYKHVPVMEQNIREAVYTNVIATKYLADAACKYGVSKFIFISTDKAVNPANVMGATKNAAEQYVLSLNAHLQKQYKLFGKAPTQYIITRFGNVWASNGSVVLKFQKQIANRTPVTITHPDVKRYFMSVSEACALVLEAASTGNGGDIYVFNLGQQMKIEDIARKLIKLAGYIPDKEIPIVYTGLRPGEKLDEQLWSENEKTEPTTNSKLIKVLHEPRLYEQFAKLIQELEEMVIAVKDDVLIEAFLKKIIPEYKNISLKENNNKVSGTYH